MTKPPRLRAGATIGVANVSGPVEEDRLERGLATLREKGYRVVEAENVRRREGFLAGSDAERAKGYRELLRDPAVDAIFFARGGYGASRVLARLDADEVRSNPKIHLGGSDLTALFAFIGLHAALATFYGPMVAVQMADEVEQDWERVLSGERPSSFEVAEGDVLAPGAGEGPLVGGCLSLLASLCGSPEAIDARGCVLFWEDVNEETYRLDRMLTQLERSDTFDGLQAMVIGSIVPGRREGAQSPEEVRSWLESRFARSPFPVVSGFPAGHLAAGRTLPLGVSVQVDASRGRVEFLESGTV